MTRVCEYLEVKKESERSIEQKEEAPGNVLKESKR